MLQRCHTEDVHALSWLCPDHRSPSIEYVASQEIALCAQIPEYMDYLSIAATYSIMIQVWAVLAFAVEAVACSQTTGTWYM